MSSLENAVPATQPNSSENEGKQTKPFCSGLSSKTKSIILGASMLFAGCVFILGCYYLMVLGIRMNMNDETFKTRYLNAAAKFPGVINSEATQMQQAQSKIEKKLGSDRTWENVKRSVKKERK